MDVMRNKQYQLETYVRAIWNQPGNPIVIPRLSAEGGKVRIPLLFSNFNKKLGNGVQDVAAGNFFIAEKITIGKSILNFILGSDFEKV